MKTHENISAAKLACQEYLIKLGEIMDQFSVYEECEDSCATIYVMADYFDESGNKKTYN